MADKRIVFRFIGGDRDGLVVDSATETPTSANGPEGARSLMRLTNNGQQGASFRTVSQRTMKALTNRQPVEELGGTGVFSYQVTERTESDDCISVALAVIPEPPQPGKHDIRGEFFPIAEGRAYGSIPPEGKVGAIPFRLTEVTAQFPRWAEITVGDAEGFPLRLNPEFCIPPALFTLIHFGWQQATMMAEGVAGTFNCGGVSCSIWKAGGVVYIDTADRRGAILRRKSSES